MKHQRQLEESRASSAAAIKELEQLQNEKRKMLMEHETQKLRELDDTYGQELREWKTQLLPRKQVIFFKFIRQNILFTLKFQNFSGKRSGSKKNSLLKNRRKADITSRKITCWTRRQICRGFKPHRRLFLPLLPYLFRIMTPYLYNHYLYNQPLG